MKERIILLGLSVVLASGILIQSLRDIVNHTILDEQWHYSIQAEIYYRDRLVQQVNQNIDQIITKYDISKKNHQMSFSNLNVQDYLNYQVEQLLNLDPNEVSSQQTNFNDEIEWLIEQDVDQYLRDLNFEFDSELENVVKAEIMAVFLEPLSIIKEIGLTMNSQNIVFDVLIPLTRSSVELLVVVLLISSISGIIWVTKFKVYRVVTYISCGCLISGIACHLINYIVNPLTLSYVIESITIQDQLLAMAQQRILNLTLIAGKILMIIGILLFVVTQGIKEYRRILRSDID